MQSSFFRLIVTETELMAGSTSNELFPAFAHTLANRLDQKFDDCVSYSFPRQSVCDCAALLGHHIHEMLYAIMEHFEADFVFDSKLLPVPFPDFPQSVSASNSHRKVRPV